MKYLKGFLVVIICVSIKMAENNEIPDNADKILFAEDLMNHVLCHTVAAHWALTAEQYRGFVYNAFNDTMKAAISFLYSKVDMQNEDIFYGMLDGNIANLATFTMYAENLSKKYFTDGFDASGFLHYCVRLTGMAVYFYNQGVLEAPNLAVKHILNVLNDVDMTTGGWDTLNTIGEQFANAEKDALREMTPPSTSDDEDSSPSSQEIPNISGASSVHVLKVGRPILFEELEEYKIHKVFLADFDSSSNSSNSPGNEVEADLKKFCSTVSVDSPPRLNLEKNKVEDEYLSCETFEPGPSNTTRISIQSTKDDCERNRGRILKEVNLNTPQSAQFPTNEKESRRSEETSKSGRHSPSANDEENNPPNKDCS